MNKEEMPRERMIKFGPSALKDEELLAIMIGYGTSKKNVVELAHELISPKKDVIKKYYVEVDGDYVMQITRTGSRGTWQDQAACFNVPMSDMKALGNPKSVTFDIFNSSENVSV